MVFVKHNRKGMGRKIGVPLLALTLAAMMPLMALAEATTDTAVADATGAATTSSTLGGTTVTTVRLVRPWVTRLMPLGMVR